MYYFFSENLEVADKADVVELPLDEIHNVESQKNDLSPNQEFTNSNEPETLKGDDIKSEKEIESLQSAIGDLALNSLEDDHHDSENRSEKELAVEDNTTLDEFESLSLSKTNTITNVIQIPMEPHASHFEADFTQLSEFEEENKNVPNSDDFEDEFDDFQDFTSASAVTSQTNETFPQYSLQISNISERIASVLDMMFPQDAMPEENSSAVATLNQSSLIINQVDSALALDFKWDKSHIRKSLMASIGVDIRGSSLQENWNPSMPRFAANLGVVPLEPLKPVKSDVPQVIPISTNEAIEPQVLVKPKILEVPAVEFDCWNSSSSSENPIVGKFVHPNPILVLFLFPA